MTGPRRWTTLDAATAPSRTQRSKSTRPKQRPRQQNDAAEPLGDGPVDGWTDTDEFLAVEP